MTGAKTLVDLKDELSLEFRAQYRRRTEAKQNFDAALVALREADAACNAARFAYWRIQEDEGHSAYVCPDCGAVGTMDDNLDGDAKHCPECGCSAITSTGMDFIERVHIGPHVYDERSNLQEVGL